ncbi:MAG: ATP-binding protein [Lachnospiraceae bacterium]|jgi:DNA replication protein DnaC
MSLTNAQYNELMRAYDARRIRNENARDARVEKIYSRYPQLRQLEQQIQTAHGELAHTAVSAGINSDAVKQARQKVTELRNARKKMLRDYGIRPEEFEVQYTCSDCKDTGYIGSEKCHCLKQAEIELLYSQSNLRKILEEENFGTFSLEYYSEEINPVIQCSNREYMSEVFSECREYAQNYRPGDASLLFTGNTGVGKTFLTHCIAKEVLDRGCSVMYITAVELFDLLARRFSFGRETENVLDSEYVMNCDMLIIDDLGSETTVQPSVSQFFYCLNGRLNAGRTTIISTNLSVSGLREVYTERISSRIISSFKIYPLYGSDIRFLKKFGKPKTDRQ